MNKNEILTTIHKLKTLAEKCYKKCKGQKINCPDCQMYKMITKIRKKYGGGNENDLSN